MAKTKSTTSPYDIMRRYMELDLQIKELEKEREKLKVQVKQHMKKNELKEEHCDEGIFKLQYQDRSSFDEDKLISILKMRKMSDCLKVVEVPDTKMVKEKLKSGELVLESLGDAVKPNIIEILKLELPK